MEDDEISSPFRSPDSSGSPMSNTFNNLPRDEEDDEIPNSLAGSPSHAGSPVRSFEEAGDEEIDSLDQINGEEDEGDFIVNAIHSSSERGEEESSSPNHREDDEDFLSRSSKRRKSPPEDRISALPDNALLHILSFLPTESAIRTGILSKRWMNLWQVSPNLIFNYNGGRNFELRISAPNLKSLAISGLWLGTKFVLLNASSLVNFHLELRRRVNGWNEEEDFTDMIGQLLRQINHAEQLTLGSSCVEVLSMHEDTKLSSILADCKCKCLTLKLKAIRDGELLGITSLLCHLPTLEKLVAYFLPEELSPSFGPYRKVEDIWTSQGRRPFSPLLQHLKTVEFMGFVVRDGFFDGFVRFLLQNASVLDKMVVRAIPYVHPSYWYTLARTLLSIQKASPRAVVYLPVL